MSVVAAIKDPNSTSTARAGMSVGWVSGLQHSHNIALPATFRPTECLIGPALCFPRAVLCSGMPARGLGPLDYTPRRTEVLFRPQRQGGPLEGHEWRHPLENVVSAGRRAAR